MNQPDLPGYEQEDFTHEGATRAVYRKGRGPAVIVIAEIPGITPKVLEFADRVVAIGCSAWLPHLFGVPGAPSTAVNAIRSIVPACVSKEFAAFATGKTAPVTDWLRALGRHAHETSGGPGIGVIGMCFTGNFALGMMVDDRLLAPVLSQPSLPIGFTKKAKADLHVSPADLDRVKERAAEGQCVLGLRFTGDLAVPPERFATLRRELGEQFIGVEIDSSKGNSHGIPRAAHSVVTEHLEADDPAHPTAKALAQVLEFFRDRLLAGGSAGGVTDPG
jgi:dienelactone hydrolase